MSRDPLERTCCSALSPNFYIYASDDPVTRLDPSGREDAEEEGLADDEVEEAANSLKTLKKYVNDNSGPGYHPTTDKTEDFLDEVLDQFIKQYNAK